MTRLFGLPVGVLAGLLFGILVVALAAVAVMGIRNRAFLRLALRNVRRRPGRSALIVVGLMLGTAIIAAALATGDTMSHTIRSTAIGALGQTDEIVSAKGASADLAIATDATGVQYFDERDAATVVAAANATGLVDGAAPAIVESIAVQDVTSRQNEPRVTLFATDPARMHGFGQIVDASGAAVSLADLAAGEVYLDTEAADELSAHAGDRIRILAGSALADARVKAVVRYDGAGSADASLLVPLGTAQSLLGQPGRVRSVLISNRGSDAGSAGPSDDVVRALQPTLAPLGLEATTAKQDALDAADAAGSAFMSFFATFGSFSIAAGVLLIFLIFVMLAAERRGELGIARAIGTRRGHLVQLFLFEGVAYNLLAAAVGAVVGAAVAYGMVLVMAGAFAATSDIEIEYSVTAQSLFVAYGIGVLLTFAVVIFSAWRVSRMNIVTAIRNLPEPPAVRRGRRRWLAGIAGLLLGAAVIASGVSAKDAVILGFGVAIVCLSAVPLALAAGVPDRAARTAAGLLLVGWFVLPMGRWLLGDLKMDFSIFILAGLMIVVGATWTIVYNADVLLGAVAWLFGRTRRLAPVLRMSIAYPLRNRFRTGVTLAMFTLVVFTLVVGATTTSAFVNAFNDQEAFGGGFEVRASASPTSPVRDMATAIRTVPGVRASDVQVTSSQSLLPVTARQVGTSAAGGDYVVRGLDTAFLDTTSFGFAARAAGYASDAAVWRALRDQPGTAVIDASVVPRRSNFNFATIQDFRLQGFYLEDRTFDPVPVDAVDPQSGASVRLSVIGVLSETAPPSMIGLSTSQATLTPVFGDRVVPTSYLFSLAPGVDAEATARSIEAGFLANGLEADATADLLADAVGASLTFDRLIEGFMGLGLIVGVAALGVITARSVVERRQQIGVLRAIGFDRRMVQVSFLIESSFIALTSIVVGTALGLAVAFNIIHDSQRQPSWTNLSFDVPWLTLAIIFASVYAVALGTTLLPAVRASRIYPAEALRYQ